MCSDEEEGGMGPLDERVESGAAVAVPTGEDLPPIAALSEQLASYRAMIARVEGAAVSPRQRQLLRGELDGRIAEVEAAIERARATQVSAALRLPHALGHFACLRGDLWLRLRLAEASPGC